jgi:seryl-tRNA synthetase
MIDLKALRANPDEMRDNLKKRNISVDLDAFLDLDREILEKNQKLDEIKNQKNIFSKLIPTLAADEKQAKLAEMKAL